LIEKPQGPVERNLLSINDKLGQSLKSRSQEMVVDIFVGTKEIKSYFKHFSNECYGDPMKKPRLMINGLYALVFIGILYMAWQAHLDWVSVLITSIFFVTYRACKIIMEMSHLEKKVTRLFEESNDNQQRYQLIIETDKIRKKMKTHEVVFLKKHFNQVEDTKQFILLKSPGMEQMFIPKYQLKSPEKLIAKLEEFIGVSDSKQLTQ